MKRKWTSEKLLRDRNLQLNDGSIQTNSLPQWTDISWWSELGTGRAAERHAELGFRPFGTLPTTRVERKNLDVVPVMLYSFGERGIKLRLDYRIQCINYMDFLQNFKSTTEETASSDQRFIFNDTALENISYR